MHACSDHPGHMPGTTNVPKEQASDRDNRSHRCRPVPAGRSQWFPVPELMIEIV